MPTLISSIETVLGLKLIHFLPIPKQAAKHREHKTSAVTPTIKERLLKLSKPILLTFPTVEQWDHESATKSLIVISWGN